MRIAYLDCFSGISGDMFLGALIDAGVPARLLEETVQSLDLGAKLEIRRVTRSGIAATKVDVIIQGEKDMPREQYWRERELKRRHEHLTGHTGEHAHDHPHHHDSTQQGAIAVADSAHRHEHAPGRGLPAIRQIISRAAISDTAKQRAIAIFHALGEAEARIHNADPDSIHFHEVGSVDALVDIVGAAVCAEALAIDEWLCSPLNVGGGTVQCAHGTFPVPAPATVELLKGAPVYSSGLDVELVTPTGAAIVRRLASRFGPFPPMTIERAGYGAGSRDFNAHPNVLRLTIGEALDPDAATSSSTDVVQVIEANLDDTTPQVLGYMQERLLEAGALDVFCAAVHMKKGRPGALVTVLARPGDAERLTGIMFAESTTLGVRTRTETRRVLERKVVTVRTRWGDVRIKVAGAGAAVLNAHPEYDDCRAIAIRHHVPLKHVIHEAMRIYTDEHNG